MDANNQIVAPMYDLRYGRELEEALGIYRDLDDQHGVGNVLWAIGSADMFANENERALPIFVEARDAFKASGDRTMEAWPSI
jgi:hypothetical protein